MFYNDDIFSQDFRNKMNSAVSKLIGFFEYFLYKFAVRNYSKTFEPQIKFFDQHLKRPILLSDC